MTESADPRAQAAAARELAARARRLAHAVGESAERGRLLQYAEELEEQAAQLEASGFAKPQVVEQQQQQQQQQGPSESTDDPPDGKKPG